MGIRVTAQQLLALRLRAQLIDPATDVSTAAPSPVDVVRHLVAMQAQDFPQALWAVGSRAPGSARSDILGSLQRGEIVRTLPMRGTLHFVASEDLRWMLILTAKRTLHSAAARFRALDLDQVTLDKAATVTHAALAGGGSLSREEFMQLMTDNAIAPDGQRGYHLIFFLCQLGLLCWGPPRGNSQALVLVDEWIAEAPARESAEALECFTLRYFASHGPATERDFSWWTKLPLRDIRAAIAALGDRLTELTWNGIDYLVATEALDAGIPSAPTAGAHALPGFDEYLLGYQDRSLALDPEHAWRIVPGNNGIFFPLIVQGGRIVGSWRRNPKTRVPEPDHFVEVTSSALAGFTRAARAYELFMAN